MILRTYYSVTYRTMRVFSLAGQHDWMLKAINSWEHCRNLRNFDPYTNARATSSDGSVVVGDSNGQAFRWTEGGGIVGLGFLDQVSDQEFPPYYPSSIALATSADGTMVVGNASRRPLEYIGAYSYSEAVLWTEDGGMVRLRATTDSSFSYATGVSADGTVIVGYFEGPLTDDHGPQPVRWDGSHTIVLPSGSNGYGFHASKATGVSGDGSVVIGVDYVTVATGGVRWVDGSVRSA